MKLKTSKNRPSKAAEKSISEEYPELPGRSAAYYVRKAETERSTQERGETASTTRFER